VSDERPLVSVCMPAYNAGRWIAAAIESVLEQTYASFELVISNNASTDETAAIVRAYDDPRIRLETTREVIGPVENHNRSVMLSTGSFVKFLHADDLLMPGCLEEMVAVALADPRIGLVFAPREILLDDTDDESNLEWTRAHANLTEHFTDLAPNNDGRALFRQVLAAGVELNWVGEPSAVMASRACLAHVGLFNPLLRQIADLDLWLRIMLSYRIGYIAHGLSVYRHHSQSVTAANAQFGLDWLDRLWLLETLLAERPLDSEDRRRVVRLRNAALRRATRTQAHRLLQRHFSSVGDFLDYWAYRSRALVGRRPTLHPVLDGPEQASARESPASAHPVPR
jgi:glycosyltransferase involved in cell wall biosynthesis